MCPSKHTARTQLAFWSERLESVRKDSEKLFGVMKKRFRVLKVPLLIRDVEVINNLFVTLSVLHNILIKHDKEFTDREGRLNTRNHQKKQRYVTLNRVRMQLRAIDDWSVRGHNWRWEYNREHEKDFNRKRNKLAEHMYHLYLTGQLEWLN